MTILCTVALKLKGIIAGDDMRINRENIWEVREGIIGKCLKIRNTLKFSLQM